MKSELLNHETSWSLNDGPLRIETLKPLMILSSILWRLNLCSYLCQLGRSIQYSSFFPMRSTCKSFIIVKRHVVQGWAKFLHSLPFSCYASRFLQYRASTFVLPAFVPLGFLPAACFYIKYICDVQNETVEGL